MNILHGDRAIELARSVCPVFRFHPLERYYPTSPEEHLADSDVYEGEIQLPPATFLSDKWTMKDLIDAENNKRLSLHHRVGKTISGTRDALTKCPIFALVRKPDESDIVLITYLLFFNVTGRCKRSLSFVLEEDGEDAIKSSAGISSVTVQLSLLQPSSDLPVEAVEVVPNILHTPSEYEIDRIFFHTSNIGPTSGFWIHEFRTRTTPYDRIGNPIRPLVYISAFTHRPQPIDGVVFRSYFTDNDYTSDGLEWDPTPMSVILVEQHHQVTEDNKEEFSPTWLNYKGSWSDRSHEVPCCITDVSWWWSTLPTNSTNVFRGFTEC